MFLDGCRERRRRIGVVAVALEEAEERSERVRGSRNRRLGRPSPRGGAARGRAVVGPEVDQRVAVSGGPARVRTGDFMGFMTPAGDFVIKAEFYVAGDFSEGLAAVLIRDEAAPRGVSWRFVDATGTVAAGTRFGGIRDLKAIFAANPRQLARNFLDQLTVYATGTPVRFSDRAEIEKMLDASAANGYRARDLVHALVRSRVFLGEVK